MGQRVEARLFDAHHDDAASRREGRGGHVSCDAGFAPTSRSLCNSLASLELARKGGLLRGGHHRAWAHPGVLATLPLGRSSFPTSVTYPRSLLEDGLRWRTTGRLLTHDLGCGEPPLRSATPRGRSLCRPSPPLWPASRCGRADLP